MSENAMKADLGARFNRWLTRFSPPRQIADKPEALNDDAAALFRIFLDHAPSEGWQGWFEDAMRRLEASMTTRSWPAPGEVVRACRAAQQEVPRDLGNSRGESVAIDMLIDWHQRFGTQMPGMGNPYRTRKLIERGVLRNLREARFKGFALSPEDADAAKAAPMGAEERRRHVETMSKLWGTDMDETDFRLQEPPVAGDPDLGANRVTDRLSGAA